MLFHSHNISGSSRHGLTFVELMISITIIAIIGTAISGFTLAVTSTWEESENTQLTQAASTRARSSIAPIIQAARGSFYVSADGNSVFFWQYDGQNGTVDGKAQYGEMALLQYNTSMQTIYYYSAKPFANMTLAEQLSASTILSAADQKNDGVMSLFKTQTWVKSPRTIIGPGRTMPSGEEMLHVSCCQFSLMDTSNGKMPGIQMSSMITRGGLQLTNTDQFISRAPTTTKAQ